MVRTGGKTRGEPASHAGTESGKRLGPLLQLEDFLPYQLNVAAAIVSEGLARQYSSRFGLDIPGWRAVATLGQLGQATAKTIGQHSHMHKTKVSRAVKVLEERGLVIRKTNLEDKREAILALTDSGLKTYTDIVPLAKAYQQRLLEGYSVQEKALFRRMLAEMSD